MFFHTGTKKILWRYPFCRRQTARIQGEKVDLGGHRCFTAAYNRNYPGTPLAIGLLDYGAVERSSS